MPDWFGSTAPMQCAILAQTVIEMMRSIAQDGTRVRAKIDDHEADKVVATDRRSHH